VFIKPSPGRAQSSLARGEQLLERDSGERARLIAVISLAATPLCKKESDMDAV